MSRKWIDDSEPLSAVDDVKADIKAEQQEERPKPNNGNGNGHSNGNGKHKKKKEMVINNEGLAEPLEEVSEEELANASNNAMMPMPAEIAEKFQASMNNNQLEDKTKYTFADKFHDERAIDYYTEFPNITGDSGVYQANRLVACASHLATMIFGEDDHIRESAKALVDHVKTHKLNMTSHKRKRILESVSAVKGDADMIKDGKDLEKRLGIRK